MKSKLSALLISLLALQLAPSIPATAQEASPSPAQDGGPDATKKTSYLRIWWMVAGSPSGATVKDVTSVSAPKSLNFADRPNAVGSYVEFPTGKRKIEIKSGSKPPINLELNNEPDAFVTLIVTDISGSLQTTLVDDVLPAGKTGRLRCYNFVKDKTATISVLKKDTATLGPGEMKELSVLRHKKSQVSVKIDLGNGTVAQSDTDVEISPSGATSLLVIPDAYGRLRPRFYTDAVYQSE